MAGKKRIEFLAQIKEMDDTTLREKIKELKMKLNKLRSTHAVSALEQSSVLAATRKDIARMKTLLNLRKKQA